MAKKKFTNKQILIGGLGIIALCLLVAVISMMFNRSTSREPTEAELQTYAPYAVEGLDMDTILAQCTQAGAEEIGDNTYATYTSDTLGQSLYQCAEITEIIVSEAGLLNLSYTDTEGRVVVLGYNSEGMTELAIYEESTDTLFHTTDGTTVVWEKFRTGYQWGA